MQDKHDSGSIVASTWAVALALLTIALILSWVIWEGI